MLKFGVVFGKKFVLSYQILDSERSDECILYMDFTIMCGFLFLCLSSYFGVIINVLRFSTSVAFPKGNIMYLVWTLGTDQK